MAYGSVTSLVQLPHLTLLLHGNISGVPIKAAICAHFKEKHLFLSLEDGAIKLEARDSCPICPGDNQVNGRFSAYESPFKIFHMTLFLITAVNMLNTFVVDWLSLT